MWTLRSAIIGGRSCAASFSDLVPSSHAFSAQLRRLSGAEAGGDHLLVRLQLVSEIGYCHAEGLRVVIRAMAGALLRAERAGEVVIRKSDIRAVLRVQRHLEEVCKCAAVSVGTSCTAGANGSGVDEMVAGGVLREGCHGCIPIHAFRCVYTPLSPAICCSVSTGGLHSCYIVGVAGKVCSEPSHYYMPVGVRGHPRKHIGLAHRGSAIHAHRSGPGCAKVRGRREE